MNKLIELDKTPTQVGTEFVGFVDVEGSERCFDFKIGENNLLVMSYRVGPLWVVSERHRKESIKTILAKPHAELRALYKEKGSDYTKWEFRHEDAISWFDCTCEPIWNATIKYRLKPIETILVNGVEVVRGETKSPELGTKYYTPSVTSLNFYKYYIWDNSCFDNRVLGHGLVHLTKENAIAHAKAMLGIKDE